MTPDYLVVGSGLAALGFGALAAHRGRRVVMLEAHEHPGGFGHTFRMGKPPDEYAFNAQLHYVWNCGPGRTVDSFLRKLGLQDEVTFERLDPAGFDRMRAPDLALDIPNDWELLKERLAALFPREADRCARFLDDVRNLGDELDHLDGVPGLWALVTKLPRLRLTARYRRATLQQVFDRHRLPLEAQTLIGLQWPDFMLPPRDLSFLAWTALFTGYMRGAYYPTRHFEHVVDTLVEHIRDRGGEVRLQHRVVDFVREGGRVVGVVAEEVDAEGTPTGPVHTLRAKQVVCGMDPRRAAALVGPEHFSRRVRRALDYDYSVSNWMAYCVVDGLDLRDHGFGRSNLFHTEELDLNRAFDAMRHGDYRAPSFAVTVPTLLTDDRSDCPPGKQILEVLTVADYSRFLHLKIGGGRAYAAKKREIFDAIFEVIERRYVPGLRDHLCLKVLGSPTTNERYVLAPQGNSYGSNMTPANIGAGRLTHHSSVPGLHFCNASSGFAGFAGTIWTGSTLYERLEGDPVLTGPHVAAG